MTSLSLVCIICQDLLNERPVEFDAGIGVSVVSTKCGHLYHQHCIEKWLGKSRECPYCKSFITATENRVLYLTGDEDSGRKLDKSDLFKDENFELKGELNQISMILEETGKNLQDEAFAHDNLKFQYAQKLSEVEELQRQIDENKRVDELTERNWKDMVDKLTKERDEVLENVRIVESKLMTERDNLEYGYADTVSLLKARIENLEIENDLLSQQIGANRVQHEENLIDLQHKQHEPIDLKTFESKEIQTDEIEDDESGKDTLAIKARLELYEVCRRHMETEMDFLRQQLGSSKNVNVDAPKPKKPPRLKKLQRKSRPVNGNVMLPDDVDEYSDQNYDTRSNSESIISDADAFFSLDPVTCSNSTDDFKSLNSSRNVDDGIEYSFIQANI